jgi:HlyD family secretion protein
MIKKLKTIWRISIFAPAFVLFTMLLACHSGNYSKYSVCKADFSQTITETGELMAVKSHTFVMPRYGRYWYQLNIIGLLEHGTVVEAGDSILQFDPSSIKKFIVEQESQLENEKANLEKLKVQLDIQKGDLLSELRNEEASFNLKKLELDQYRFEPEKVQKIKKLEFKQAEILLTKSKRKIELNKTIAENDLIIQKNRVVQNQKNVREAYKVLSELTIRTPISGVFQVGNKNYSNEKIRVGDAIYYGTSLGSVPDLTWMKVKSSINETDIKKIKKGQPVNVRLDALPNVIFKGEVSFISKLCHRYDNTKRKIFDVEIEMLTSDNRLKPGMTVSCEYICNKFENVLFVSNECLLFEQGRHYLFVKKGSSYSKVEVAVMAQNNSQSVVEGNIEKGQLLVPVETVQSKKE